MNKQRLLAVAKAVRESPDPESFCMAAFGGYRLNRPRAQEPSCGTPFCVLGHYAARADLQDDFKLIDDGLFERNVTFYGCSTSLGYNYTAVLKHFVITPLEAEELFGCSGCGNATTPEQAAAYIEEFVRRQEF